MSRPVGERGVAGVLVLALASILALVGALSSSLAAVAVARQRAAGVADLAALAAAGRALDGSSVACDRAAALAGRNGGRLTSFPLDGEQAEVVAEVRPAGVLGGLGAASARASAGPARARAGPVG